MIHMLFKFFYRLVAPSHPRGYVDFCFIPDDPAKPSGSQTVTSIGMKRFGSPDVAIQGVPLALLGNAHAILFEIMAFMRDNKTIKSGEHIHGNLVADAQPSMHHATVYSVPVLNPAQLSLFKVVDLGRKSDAGFPYQLFAAHLNALAARTRNPSRALDSYRKSILYFPDSDFEFAPDLSQFNDNENNCLAYFGISNTLYDLGRMDEALENAKLACQKSPSWAQRIRKQIQDTIPETERGKISDPLTLFWLNGD